MPTYRSASGSSAEDLFIELFSDTFGAEKAGYLYSQYPFSDIYQNIMSNKMNDIIRILTIISTILMPLTFIAGLYGMNFNVSDSPWNMPELHHPYGYPITLLLMLAIALGMIWFFKKKDWL